MKGIETAAKKNKHLYKKFLKSTCTDQDITIYKVHQNMLNGLRRSSRMAYYNSKYFEYRQNTKKLWGLINQTIKKCKNGRSIIPCISVNGLQTYNSTEIANNFGNFYASIGNELASTITTGKHEVNHYLQLILKTDRSLVLREMSVREIERLINSLPNKTSYGHDKVTHYLNLCAHPSRICCKSFSTSLFTKEYFLIR